MSKAYTVCLNFLFIDIQGAPGGTEAQEKGSITNKWHKEIAQGHI